MGGGAALPVDPATLPVSRSNPSQSHILLEFAQPKGDVRRNVWAEGWLKRWVERID